jgi:energy-converting hydrogenase Eha subunit B
MLKFYVEVLLNLRSFISVKLSRKKLLGVIYVFSVYSLIITGLVWLFNNASLDNKHFLFYILLAIASIQSALQERKIILMKKILDEKIK